MSLMLHYYEPVSIIGSKCVYLIRLRAQTAEAISMKFGMEAVHLSLRLLLFDFVPACFSVSLTAAPVHEGQRKAHG